MDLVNSAQLFVRVAETCSFSKAASELGISQSTATKAIAASESRLGVRLLHRSTRGVTLTELGALYYEKCKLIESAVDEAENIAVLGQSTVGGQLRISTSVAFGRRMLVPIVLRYMQVNPLVKIDISFDDRYVNLVEQGIDLAIRMGQMADSNLGARYFGSNPWVMVAANQYLEHYGEPKNSSALSNHACIVYSSVQGDDRWRLTSQQYGSQSVQVKGPFRSNNLSAVLAATTAGMGLAILPLYVAHESIASGVIRPVMQEYSIPSQEMHAVYTSPKLVAKKITNFIDFLQQSFSGDWWMQKV